MSFVPGAASTAVRDLLDAARDAPVQAVVRHVGATRVGLQAGTRLLVLDRTTGPHTLPCTITAPLLDPSDVGAPGDVVRVEAGRVHGLRQTVQVTRWWHPAQVRPTGQACSLRASRFNGEPEIELEDLVRTALHAAAGALLAGRAGAAANALVDVLGRGAGSTPDADDAVAGLLLAARHDLPDRTDVVTQAARLVAGAAVGRTTVLSAELLRSAAQGCAATAVVAAVSTPSPANRAGLLRLGGTSGRSTAAGIDLFRAHMAAASPGRAA